jgi:(p)ppGpp synthase/HD superfamily hydrolase
MNNESWISLYEKCFEEAEGLFEDDVPPLDNELIYGGMKEIIQAKRKSIADDWLQRSVPTGKQIGTFNATQANQCRKTLNNAPPVLSGPQIMEVNTAITACETRLDDLEVEGVMAKFNSLSESNKKAFVALISQYLRGLVEGKARTLG